MEEKSKYYDGTKLLSMKDINGNKPWIYVCTSNRSAGKTTWWARYLTNKFIKQGKKFMLLYKFAYEIDNVHEKFFKDVQKLFFPGYLMQSTLKEKGVYAELTLNGAPCGYATALNKSEAVKKLSHMFSDTEAIFMDEFQSETNTYVPKELQKFLSIYKSVARGNGEMMRYVPVYMVSNPVTLLNPYYIGMNITSRLRNDTKFLKGDGFVIEQGYNEAAAEAQEDCGVFRAFKDDKYVAYSKQGVYLNDNLAFIGKPVGFGRYLCTIKYEGVNYGVREYQEDGVVYCDNRADESFPLKITVTTEDHDINYVMLKTNSMTLSLLRYYFDKGCFRFKDIRCKEAILNALSY